MVVDAYCQVMYNLHVVFTMNPSSEGLKDRAATSPALFNRSVFLELIYRSVSLFGIIMTISA